jgi:hypothetical protein
VHQLNKLLRAERLVDVLVGSSVNPSAMFASLTRALRAITGMPLLSSSARIRRISSSPSIFGIRTSTMARSGRRSNTA